MASKVDANASSNILPAKGGATPLDKLAASVTATPVSHTTTDPRLDKLSQPSRATTPPVRDGAAVDPQITQNQFFELLLKKVNKASQEFASWYYGPLDNADAVFTARAILEAGLAASVLTGTLIGAVGALGQPTLGLWLIGGGAMTTISGLVSQARSIVPEFDPNLIVLDL